MSRRRGSRGGRPRKGRPCAGAGGLSPPRPRRAAEPRWAPWPCCPCGLRTCLRWLHLCQELFSPSGGPQAARSPRAEREGTAGNRGPPAGAPRAAADNVPGLGVGRFPSTRLKAWKPLCLEAPSRVRTRTEAQEFADGIVLSALAEASRLRVTALDGEDRTWTGAAGLGANQVEALGPLGKLQLSIRSMCLTIM